MESLILLIIFGLGAAYFATQNTGSVHILLGSFLISGIPLYVVVIGAMLLGVFASWLLSIVDKLSASFTIHGKDSQLKRAETEIEKLQEKNTKLELELAKLSKAPEITQEKDGINELPTNPPSLFKKVRQSIHLAS